MKPQAVTCFLGALRYLVAAALVASLLAASLVVAQDPHESLGPKDQAERLKGRHPLVDLMASLKASLRPEFIGQHPRVYVTEGELAGLRRRAQTTHRALWQRALEN